MPRYNPYEERILRTLARGRRRLTTKKISDFAGISYNTTKNYLHKLSRQDVVSKIRRGNKIYWWL